MRRIETIVIVVALAFYFWFLRYFGFARVLEYIRLAGWGLVITVSLEAIPRVANTLGWRVTIPDYPARLSFRRLFGARVAGEAVDYVTPSGQLSGQFLMALIVRKHLALPEGLASSLAASLAEAVGQVTFVILALLLSLPIALGVRWLFWPAVGGLGIAVALTFAAFFVQRRRPFSFLWRIARRLELSRFSQPEIGKSAERADSLLFDFYQHHRLRFLLSSLLYVAAWGSGPIELYLLFRFLNEPEPFQFALLVEAAGILIERATFFLPAKLASQEGGKALIVAMLGLPASAGFAVGLLRRTKELIWVAFGLVMLTAHRILSERGSALEETVSDGGLPALPAAARLLGDESSL
jgi:hypothetical protein